MALTDNEREYFNATIDKIKSKIAVNIPIEIADHDHIKGHKNALGICYADENRTPILITIDEYFIHECYEAEFNGKWWMLDLNEGRTLTSVICHEIAHITHWRHGKKHTDLTNKFIAMVEFKQAA